MCPIVEPREGLEELLLPYLRGDPEARREFPRIAAPFLTGLARRYAGFLPPDLRNDVVQEAHMLVLTHGMAGFDPSRGTASSFLRLVVRRATRQVAAMHTVPGSRTRPPAGTGNPEGKSATTHIVLPIHGLPEALEPVAIGMELIPERRCDVASVLAAAPTLVEMALERIYLDEMPIGEVAVELGVSRFQINRAIASFAVSFSACA